MILDIGQIINQLGKEKGIDRSIIIGAIKDALESAAKKKYGMNKRLEAMYDEDTGDFEVLEFRTVVNEVTDEEMEISLAEARELDPEARLNDSIGFRMSTKDLGRIAAQTARQIIMQKVKDAEREVIYNEFITRKGEILNGIVQRYERDTIIVDLGRTEAVMPPSEQIPRERYRQGDRIRAYIKDVSKTTRGPEILLSRADPRVILKFFEQEVPEVYEGVVSILSVAREPGFRTKIAVKSKERDVDPVGACVGMKGSRVQSVVQELRGSCEIRVQRAAARGDHSRPGERVRENDGGHCPRGAAPSGDRKAGTKCEAGVQARGVEDRGPGGRTGRGRAQEGRGALCTEEDRGGGRRRGFP
jgi:N utilization substance protein A